MKTILSTRKLSTSQRDLILGRGHSVIDYSAIQITPLDFQVQDQIDNVIFTSVNAVTIFFEKKLEKVELGEIFCVGDKTEQKLAKYGQKVTKKANNSTELGQYLSKNYQNQEFWYFCSEQRMDHLPDLLKSSKNRLIEVKIYEIDPILQHFDQIFDAILFFSPSGVNSFFEVNKGVESALICIGDTTAKAASKFSEKVWTAQQATVESVIAKTVKVLNHDKE